MSAPYQFGASLLLICESVLGKGSTAFKLSTWKPYITVILWSIKLNNKHNDNNNDDENNNNKNYYYYQ